MTWQGVPLPTTGRADWLEKRKAGIGASDVAGILGLSPWATPFTVWADKTKDLADDQNESMYWGSALEDVVADEFEKQTGLHVHGRQWLVRHPDYEWAMATIDGFAEEAPWEPDEDEYIEPLGLVEVKTDSTFGGWKDGIPDHYRIQIQWQMFVTGLTRCWVAVLHGGRTFRIYDGADDPVEFDPDLAEKIFRRVSEFRDRYIVGDETPDADSSDATARILTDLWEADDEKVIELSGDMAADLEALRGWKREQKRVDARVKELEARIKTSLQEATVGTVGGVEAVTWKPVTSRRVDSKRLKSERPDVYEKFSKESSYRRFMVKEES